MKERSVLLPLRWQPTPCSEHLLPGFEGSLEYPPPQHSRPALSNMVATEHMWLLSICGVASLHCAVNVRCRPEFKDSVWKKECKHMINNFLYWLHVEIDINILGELYIKINFTCFSLFFYLATGNFKITYVPHIIFLLDSAALGPSLAQGSGYLFQLEGQMETPWQQPWGWQEPWQCLFLPVSYTGENQLITCL